MPVTTGVLQAFGVSLQTGTADQSHTMRGEQSHLAQFRVFGSSDAHDAGVTAEFDDSKNTRVAATEILPSSLRDRRGDLPDVCAVFAHQEADDRPCSVLPSHVTPWCCASRCLLAHCDCAPEKTASNGVWRVMSGESGALWPGAGEFWWSELRIRFSGSAQLGADAGASINISSHDRVACMDGRW